MNIKYMFKGNIKELQSQISTAENLFNEDHPDQYTTLQASITGDLLKIGLERSGHSNGYWCHATLNEASGNTLIEGIISEEDPTKWYEWILIILLWIGLFPFIILVRIIMKDWPRNKRRKLDRFMQDYLNCVK